LACHQYSKKQSINYYRRIIVKHPYDDKFGEKRWETSSLRRYLNNVFYWKLSREVQDIVIETMIDNYGNKWYGGKDYRKTVDKVFLLSIEEAERFFGNTNDYLSINRKQPDIINGKFNGLFFETETGSCLSNEHDVERRAKYQDKQVAKYSQWWLRTNGMSEYNVSLVSAVGNIYVAGEHCNNENCGVRPAMWISL
jgi:hypothetical protein